MFRRTIIVMALAAVASAGVIVVSNVNAQQTTISPFTATLIESRFGNHGQKTRQETLLQAVRSDGSSVTLTNRTFPDGKQYQERTIIDLRNRKRIVIDPATESVTTYSLSAPAIAAIVAKFTSCRKIQGEKQDINGHAAVHEVVHTGLSPVVHDRWLALDLNCFPMKQTVLKDAGKPQSTHNEIATISISLGEPDAALFMVPLNYTERSPDEVMAEFRNRFPNAPSMDFPEASNISYRNSKPR